ncbi:MAG: T9SS type A sorting domain-containing protein [Calditrichaeota bacterium]|nr:T9SS type A sorting domain-containing protein [Calditrichota bacterium]
MMRKEILFVLCALFVSIHTAQAQITLTVDDVPPLGTRYTFYELENVTFNPGNGGGNQAWDVAGFGLTETSEETWTDPAQSPFGSEFPGATVCIHEIGFDEEIFTYARIENSGAYGLGFGIIEADTSYFAHTETDALLVPLPLMIGSQWTTLAVLEIEPEPGIVIQQRDSSVHEIDGWGLMATPYWTGQTLRDSFYETHQTYMNGNLIEEYEEYSYTWFSQTAGQEVNFTCSDACEPGFTQGDLSVARNTTTAIDPQRGPLAIKFQVSQNYPNPFNPTTVLPVQLMKSGRLELTIFNELGQVVSRREFELLAGSHSLPIDGASWSSGAYFAEVRTQDGAQSMPMRLVK